MLAPSGPTSLRAVLMIADPISRRDSFPNQSTEVFILQMMVKNFLFYAFSTFINSWAAKSGAGEVFKTWGIVSICLLATCIPMCKSFAPPKAPSLTKK